MSATGVFQRMRAIDEKHSIVNIVFLAGLCEKLLSENTVCCRFKLYMM